MACSALRSNYRGRLAGADAGRRVRFVYLAGDAGALPRAPDRFAPAIS